jgi:hypothetical protein
MDPKTALLIRTARAELDHLREVLIEFRRSNEERRKYLCAAIKLNLSVAPRRCCSPNIGVELCPMWPLCRFAEPVLAGC